ncbi:MAG: MASE1 domain-containing protein [Burkholderiaceae bacterium]|nr:MASE1 domain-containing protein [Burkholderiaceae bacterium]
MKIGKVDMKPLRLWSLIGALVVLYFLAGKLGLQFAFLNSSATAVWPPTGIALAAVLLLGYRVAPAVLIGAFLVNITTTGSLLSSLGIASGNTLEAVVGAFLVNRYAGGIAAFNRARDILSFSFLAGLVSTAISATIGVTSLALTGYAETSQLGAIWLTWWLGDAAGALIVAPLILLWGTTRNLGQLRQRPAESILLLLTIVAVGALVFVYSGLNRYPLPFLCIPPLVWAAFRFGQREVATGVAILSAIAGWATVSGWGPFVMQSENESLLLLQAFMGTIAAMTLPVAALIWERKAVELERGVLLERERAARADAEAANLAKDEFLAMLSHELRNPLAAIGNATQVLVDLERQHAFGGRAVEIIHRQTKHLSRLVDDLLDVGRVTAGKIVLTRLRVNLADVVEKSLAVYLVAGRLQDYRTEVELAPVWVNGDADRLSQIIDNLLTNSIKYTPAGGLIRVQTLLDGDEAVMRITDSGIGIAPDLLPRVFDLFTQEQRSLDRAQGGIGVGLTLVRRLVELHGGRVDAYSEGVSKGSTFSVRLPRAESRRTEEPSLSPVVRPTPAMRILIVEDDADGREALRMQLVMSGYEVHEAIDGESGLELVQRLQPDVVLLDIGLPGLDGYEVARRLKSAQICPRLVAITGYGRPEDHERAMTAGFDQHLTKPVDYDELQRALESRK